MESLPLTERVNWDGCLALTNDAQNRCLRGRAAAGPWIERTRRPAPQRFRQELLVRRGNGAGADVCRALGAFVRSLVVVEFSFHVDAIDGIVDAVLNVPEVIHEDLPAFHRSAQKRELESRVPRSGGTAAAKLKYRLEPPVPRPID